MATRALSPRFYIQPSLGAAHSSAPLRSLSEPKISLPAPSAFLSEPVAQATALLNAASMGAAGSAATYRFASDAIPATLTLSTAAYSAKSGIHEIPSGQSLETFFSGFSKGERREFHLGFSEDGTGMIAYDASRKASTPWNCDFRVVIAEDGTSRIYFADPESDTHELWKSFDPRDWSEDAKTVAEAQAFLATGIMTGATGEVKLMPENQSALCYRILDIYNLYVEQNRFGAFQELMRMAHVGADGLFHNLPGRESDVREFSRRLDGMFGIRSFHLRFNPDGSLVARQAREADERIQDFPARIVSPNFGIFNLYIWDGEGWVLFDGSEYAETPRSVEGEAYASLLESIFTHDGENFFNTAAAQLHANVLLDEDAFVMDTETYTTGDTPSGLLEFAQTILASREASESVDTTWGTLVRAYIDFILSEFLILNPDSIESRFLLAVRQYHTLRTGPFTKKNIEALAALQGKGPEHFQTALNEAVKDEIMRRLTFAIVLAAMRPLDEENILQGLDDFTKALGQLEVTPLDDAGAFQAIFDFAQKHGGKKKLGNKALTQLHKILARHGLIGDHALADATSAPWQPWNAIEE